MRNRLIWIFFTLIGLATTSQVLGHEYWLEPRKFAVKPGEIVEADLKNGQHFKGGKLYYLNHRFKRFEIHTNSGQRKAKGNDGDQPALRYTAKEPGLHILVYESIFDELTFEKWDKFLYYLKLEGLEDIVERHKARKLPQNYFNEQYSRRVKSLVKVGDGAGKDRLMGLGYEMVAEENPYQLSNDGKKHKTLPVRVYLKDQPYANAQINIFQDNGKVHETHVRTDANGLAMIPITGGGKIMLSSVYMYDGDNDEKTKLAEWQSLWANLTFELPISEGSVEQ